MVKNNGICYNYKYPAKEDGTGKIKIQSNLIKKF